MSRFPKAQLSFADLELRHQGVHLDPLLQGILTFLDDHAPLVEQVRQDLVRGLKNPNTGRDGITPSQTLRSLILMRVKNWDYRGGDQYSLPHVQSKAGVFSGSQPRQGKSQRPCSLDSQEEGN
jgi:hypothetical protein